MKQNCSSKDRGTGKRVNIDLSRVIAMQETNWSVVLYLEGGHVLEVEEAYWFLLDKWQQVLCDLGDR